MEGGKVGREKEIGHVYVHTQHKDINWFFNREDYESQTKLPKLMALPSQCMHPQLQTTSIDHRQMCDNNGPELHCWIHKAQL